MLTLVQLWALCESQMKKISTHQALVKRLPVVAAISDAKQNARHAREPKKIMLAQQNWDQIFIFRNGTKALPFTLVLFSPV